MRAATALGCAMLAGESEGIEILYEQPTVLGCDWLAAQFTETMSKLTPVVAAMPSCTASKAAELDEKT